MVGARWRAVESYLDTGDPSYLGPFKGKVVADYLALDTDTT